MKMKMLTAENIRSLQPHNLREMRENGLTVREIAKNCGVSEWIIQMRIKEYGLKLPKGRKKN